MTAADLPRLRFDAQGLHRRATSAERVVGDLLAVQAQDLRAAGLAVSARLRRARPDAVVDGLEACELTVGWLCRGTLHLVRSEDLGWLHALTAPPRMAANVRRLREEGVSEAAAERGVRAIERAIADQGPLTRHELGAHVAAARVPTDGQALVHVIMRAALEGRIVRGAERFALWRDRLGEPAGIERDAALAELARRYLISHGPATARDLAAWSGLTVRDARRGLSAIAGELAEHPGGLVDLRGRGRPPKPAPSRLLGPFDPYMLGWSDRSFAVPPGLARRVHPGGGVIRAVVVADGVVAGTWNARGEIDAQGDLDARALARELRRAGVEPPA